MTFVVELQIFSCSSKEKIDIIMQSCTKSNLRAVTARVTLPSQKISMCNTLGTILHSLLKIHVMIMKHLIVNSNRESNYNLKFIISVKKLGKIS